MVDIYRVEETIWLVSRYDIHQDHSGKIYRIGDIIYLNLAGQPVIVLNSLKAAADILDRRAGLTSDRPSYIVASELMSQNMFMGFTPYNDLYVFNVLV